MNYIIDGFDYEPYLQKPEDFEKFETIRVLASLPRKNFAQQKLAWNTHRELLKLPPMQLIQMPPHPSLN